MCVSVWARIWLCPLVRRNAIANDRVNNPSTRLLRNRALHIPCAHPPCGRIGANALCPIKVVKDPQLASERNRTACSKHLIHAFSSMCRLSEVGQWRSVVRSNASKVTPPGCRHWLPAAADALLLATSGSDFPALVLSSRTPSCLPPALSLNTMPMNRCVCRSCRMVM